MNERMRSDTRKDTKKVLNYRPYAKVTKLSDIDWDDSDVVGEKLVKARERVRSGVEIADAWYTDDQGRVFLDVSEAIENDDKVKRQMAIARHGNSFNARLDECGFPFDRKDRKFILTHVFGEPLDFIMANINKTWIYLYGDPGRGKTSLAIRAVWEMIKNYPEREATFISVGKWMKSLQAGNQEYIDLSKMKRIVVIDDYDKFDKSKDFQIRQLLLLIEELKNRHLVIITSNHSLEEMLSFNNQSLDLEVMIDRIKGKSVVMPRFTGESHR